jgi:hypothetical protein
VHFIAGGRALERGKRMLELWNNWYDTLATVEALATVIVIVLVAAGAITLAEAAAINASEKCRLCCKSRFSPMTKILRAVGATFVYKM